MPDFFAPWTDPTDGSVYKIPVPTDPRVNVEEYLQSYVKAQRAAKQSQASKYPSSPTGKAVEARGLMDKAMDAGNAANQTIMDASKGVVKQAVTGIPLTVGKALGTVPPETTAEDIGMNPTSAAQKVGGYGEQVAEFMFPASKVSTATKGLGLATRAGAQALTGYGIGRLQGQTREQAAVSGATAGAFTGITEGAWPPIKDWVTKKVTSRVLNSLMEIKPQWVEHGADPGGQVIKEGIVANSKEALAEQIAPKLKDAGQELQTVLTTKGAGRVVNADSAVRDAVTNAAKTIGKRSDKAFQDALAGVLDDVLSKVPSGKSLNNLTPLEAQELKSQIGDAITWTGRAYEGDINKVLLEMYGGIKDEIVKQVPGASEALQRYGNLRVALNGTRAAVNADKVRPIIPKSISGLGNKALNAAAGSTRAGQAFNPTKSDKSTVGARLIQSIFGAISSNLKPDQ